MPRSGNNHRANSQNNTPRNVWNAQPTMQPTTSEMNCYTGGSSLPEKQTACENSMEKRSGERGKTVSLFILPKAIPCGKAENTPSEMPKSHG